MAETMHDLLRALHVSTGFVGLAAFWIPALARKGGRLHVGAGRVFAACAYVVALSALGSTSWALLHPSSWAGRTGAAERDPAGPDHVRRHSRVPCPAAARRCRDRRSRDADAPSAGPVRLAAPAVPRSGPGRGRIGAVRLRYLPRRPRGRRPVLDSGSAGRRHRGRPLRGCAGLWPIHAPRRWRGGTRTWAAWSGPASRFTRPSWSSAGSASGAAPSCRVRGRSCRGSCRPSWGFRRCTSGRATTSGSSGSCRSRSRRDRRSVRLGRGQAAGAGDRLA